MPLRHIWQTLECPSKANLISATELPGCAQNNCAVTLPRAMPWATCIPIVIERTQLLGPIHGGTWQPEPLSKQCAWCSIFSVETMCT
jgi:hypothetical protein